MRLRVLAVAALVAVLTGCSASQRHIDTLRRDEDAARRAAAAEALGNSSPSDERKPAVVAALREATADPSENVRQKAIEALGKLGGPEATAALAAALTSKNFTAEAFSAFKNANSLSPDSPEVLLGVARTATELGGAENLKTAEETLDDLAKLLDQIDPQAAQMHVYSLKFAYDNLRLKFQQAGNNAKVKELEGKIAKAEAKIGELNAANPAGGGGLPFPLQ